MWGNAASWWYPQTTAPVRGKKRAIQNQAAWRDVLEAAPGIMAARMTAPSRSALLAYNFPK